ncbi:MAG TPA: ABC transporter permease [Azospirillaceae bacterium]|nr:ABC transporter permease [Azospirillaceae bacterium]
MGTRIRALFIKEILAVWRDRKSRFVLIVPPLVQLFVFSYAATYDVTNVPIAVLDQDRTAASRELVSRFAASTTFTRILYLDHPSQIASIVDAKEAMMVVHIGADFERRLLRQPPAPVQLILDGRMSNTAQIVQGYANAVITGFAHDRAAAAGLPGLPTTLVSRAWFNPNLESLWVVVPGLVAVLTQVIGLVVTALSVARERELGTFEQLLVTPLRPWEILLGKTLPGLIIGLAEGTVIVVAAVTWFGVPFTGSLLLLYASLAVFLLAIIGVGLFISALAATQQQAILGAFLFLVPAIVLSGFATPVENMPAWIQALTQANPMRHFLVIVQGVFLKDLPLILVWAKLWPMMIIAAVTLSLAAWLFRHRLS